jgi:TolB-like protein
LINFLKSKYKKSETRNKTMKVLRQFKYALIAFIAMAIIPFIVAPTQAAGTSVKKIAVCPLEINSAQDLTFLQKGLFTMLYSRLTDPGKVEVLDRDTIDKALAKTVTGAGNTPFNKTKAMAMGETLGVDYVLFGSMTQFGNSVSLDLSVVDVKGIKPDLVFSKQANEPGAVITEMDKMATKINLDVFNRKPELLIPKEQMAQATEPGIRYTSPPSEATAQFSNSLSNYRHVFTAKGIINGIACGDTNGDKKQEVVIIYEHRIEILQAAPNGKLIRQSRIDDSDYMDIIGLDIADINGNGLAEIFVTRIGPRTGRLQSFVLEFQSGSYKKIAKDLPWYFRVIKDIHDNKKLFVQKNSSNGPYSERGVFSAHWENNAYVPGERISVPDGFNIMSFALDNLSGTSKRNAVFTDMYGNLKLFNETGTVEWSGDETYGGSELFYTFVEKDESMSPQFRESKGVYFQPRNIFSNINSDEQTHVLAIRNKDAAGGFLKQFRKFTSGYIELGRLTEMGLTSDIPAKKLPGQITDFMIWTPNNEMANKSKKELWITIVKKRDSFFPGDSTSLIVAYDF